MSERKPPMPETTASDRESIESVPEFTKPPYEGTRLRPVRIEDELWHDTGLIAEELGENRAEIMRAALVAYRRKHARLLKRLKAEEEGS